MFCTSRIFLHFYFLKCWLCSGRCHASIPSTGEAEAGNQLGEYSDFKVSPGSIWEYISDAQQTDWIHTLPQPCPPTAHIQARREENKQEKRHPALGDTRDCPLAPSAHTPGLTWAHTHMHTHVCQQLTKLQFKTDMRTEGLLWWKITFLQDLRLDKMLVGLRSRGKSVIRDSSRNPNEAGCGSTCPWTQCSRVRSRRISLGHIVRLSKGEKKYKRKSQSPGGLWPTESEGGV